MKNRYLILVFILIVCQLNIDILKASKRVVNHINTEWKFILEDVPDASEMFYDDSAWRILNVPHDWAFEKGYSKNGTQSDKGGYASGGIGWYRKTFRLSSEDCLDHRIYVDFDAVYMNSEVWINGHYLGKRPYGYISFGYEITSFVKPGNNIISVRVDNSHEPSARWYHGCGIYGNVSLSILPVNHLMKWGTGIVVSRIDADKAFINISSEVDIKTNKPLSLEYVVFNSKKEEIVRSSRMPLAGNVLHVNGLEIKNPELWDLQTPNLYTLSVRLFELDELIDEKEETFGIRNVRWDAETGFWLNGSNIKMRGVCEHLEGGPIGAAWTENLMRWKIKLLKDMGCNAIRTTHNPQLPMFYDICDELGMLVLDELFDGWKKKADEDYGKQAFDEWWKRDLKDFILRDRNHPSVVAYSLGNETNGIVAEEMVDICHKLDSTRLVTSGHSGSDCMDILGMNGHSEKKTFFENYKPTNRAFIGTENPHTWQVRGYYRTHTWYRDGFSEDRGVYEIPNLTEKELFHYEWASPEIWKNGKQHFNSSYDNATVRINVRRSIENLRDLPWYSASFRWTGFDYLGEAGYVHGGWPFRAFMGGVIDLAGFPKDHYYLYQSQWGNKSVVHILPHWSHPNMKIGEKIPVWVYTSGDTAELFLNGKSLGKRHRGMRWNEMQCEWMVPWQPGKLVAVAYKDGIEIGKAVHVTVNSPKAIQINTSDACLTGKSEDIHIIDIAATDKNGNLYPYGENRVYWTIGGNGEIVSAENGNPVDVETNWHAESKSPFFGLLRLFVRNEDQKGVSLYAVSILGDKRLKLDDKISIDVRGIDLKGNSLDVSSFKIYYTTDGSDPAVNGKIYHTPFEMKYKGIVRAIVKAGDSILLKMQESFGPAEGLYWGTEDDMADLLDVQAENCRVKGGVYRTSFPGFQSSGYIETGKSTVIGFYQENDGSDIDTEITYRFVPLKVGNVSVSLFNNDVMTTDVFEVSSDDIGKWNDRKIRLRLRNGANNIKFAIEGVKICIDGFSFVK